MLIDIKQQLQDIDHFIRKYGLQIHLEKYNNRHNQLIYYVSIARTDTQTIKDIIKRKVYPNIIKIIHDQEEARDPALDQGDLTGPKPQLDWLYVDHNKMKTILELRISLQDAKTIDLEHARNFFQQYFGEGVQIDSSDKAPIIDFIKVIDAIKMYQITLQNYRDALVKNFNKERCTLLYHQRWNDLALHELRHSLTDAGQLGGSKIKTNYVNLTRKGKFNYLRNLSKQVVFRPDVEGDHIGLAIKFNHGEGKGTGIVTGKTSRGYQVATAIPTPGKTDDIVEVTDKDVDEINLPIDNKWHSFQQNTLFHVIERSQLIRQVKSKNPAIKSSFIAYLKKHIDLYILQNKDSILAKIIDQDRHQYLLDLKEAFVV